MQPTTRFHNGITNAILQETDFVFHNPLAFHSTNGVFNADSDGGNPTIGRFLRRREFPTTRCFLRLEDRDARQAKALEAFLLIEATAGWKGLACQLGHALIRGFSFTGVAQEAHVTGLIAHEEICERVTLLLATVIFVLLFGICRAVDRTFATIMPKRGGWSARPSRASRPARQTLQLFGPEAVLGRLRPDSTRDAARESMCSRSLDSSHRAGLAPLEWDAVSRRSE